MASPNAKSPIQVKPTINAGINFVFMEIFFCLAIFGKSKYELTLFFYMSLSVMLHRRVQFDSTPQKYIIISGFHKFQPENALSLRNILNTLWME